MKSTRLKRIQTMALTLLVIAGVINYFDRTALSIANAAVSEEMNLTAAEMGFLLSAFSFYNLAVYAVITYLQLYRILREEALLANLPEYRAYMNRVPYRLFYGIA